MKAQSGLFGCHRHTYRGAPIGYRSREVHDAVHLLLVVVTAFQRSIAWTLWQPVMWRHVVDSRACLKRDGTRAETRFGLSAKRTSPFKSAGASVQSTTGSRGVRISGSNAGYTMFRGSVKSTGYPLHSPVSSFTSLPVRYRVPSYFNWTLPTLS